jgi:hypothetical protein
MSKFWRKIAFWDKVKNTLALFGAPGGALAGYLQTNPTYLIIGILCAILSGAIAIWFTDSDKDGTVDIFQ